MEEQTVKLGVNEENQELLIPQKPYYDTALSTSPYALCSLQELVEPSQILFGSDYAFASKR